VPHDRREEFLKRPLHATVRLCNGLPNLRSKREHAVLLEAFERCGQRAGFGVRQWSIQGNHIHLIVEAERREDLTRGMTGLLTSIARRLNKLWQTRGRVLADRFHARVLRTPIEVRNALRYVLHNARNHGLWLWPDRPDPYSSGEYFDGWADYPARSLLPPWLAAAATWLLRTGWQRAGPLQLAYD